MYYKLISILRLGSPSAYIALTAIFILPITGAIHAQILEAEVSIELQQLRVEKRQKLADFAEKIQHYINSYQWCEDKWGNIIPINIQMVLEDISSGSEERYKSTFLINNNYDIQFYDKRWRFAYRSGEMIVHEEGAVNSLSGLIDFYIYLILGGEFDKSATLGGAVYYEKARDIAEQSRFGLGRFIEGWDRRLELVRDLLSDQHKPFREMVDYYFYGLSFVGEDNAEARKHCATAVKMLDKIIADDPENEYCKDFIAAHHIELLEIFKRSKDKSTLRLLMVIDPEHERTYREFID
jgi:hypothetical protein